MGCSRDFNSVVMGVLQLFAACLSLWDPIAFFAPHCMSYASFFPLWPGFGAETGAK